MSIIGLRRVKVHYLFFNHYGHSDSKWMDVMNFTNKKLKRTLMSVWKDLYFTYVIAK